MEDTEEVEGKEEGIEVDLEVMVEDHMEVEATLNTFLAKVSKHRKGVNTATSANSHTILTRSRNFRLSPCKAAKL